MWCMLVLYGWRGVIIKLLMSYRHEAGSMPWDRTGNRLLVKSQLGGNKPTNYQIPQGEFVYGKITPDDPEHANQVMYAWQNHAPSLNRNHNKVKDMLQTNKLALRGLLHTSAQFTAHRKDNTLYKAAKEGTNIVPIKLPEASHAYGKPLDLQDPIRLVIANSYGEDDKVARHTFYAHTGMQQSQPTRKLSCYITKNHLLRKEATEQRLSKFDWNKKEDPSWKINKFTQVGFKVDTRRNRASSIK